MCFWNDTKFDVECSTIGAFVHKFQKLVYLQLFTVLFHKDYSTLIRMPVVSPHYSTAEAQTIFLDQSLIVGKAFEQCCNICIDKKNTP